MSKIIRAYTEEKPVTFDLLKSINSGQIAEAGFVDKLKGAVKGAVDGYKSDKNPPPPADVEDTDDDSEGGTPSELSVLKTIVAQVVNSSAKRFIVYLNFLDLKNLYLKAGGGKGVIDSITEDDKLVEFAELKTPTNAKVSLRAMPESFTFADQINAKQGFAVLLDIPKDIADAVVKNKTNPTELRASLEQMMLHKYYVCTLNISKARAIAQAVDGAEGDIEKQTLAFNPDVLENYPNRQRLNSAKEEWNNHFGGEGKKEADIDAKEREVARANRDPDNQGIQIDPSKGVVGAIPTIFASAKGNTDEERISSIVAKLLELHEHFPSATFKDVIDNLSKLVKVWGAGSIANQVLVKLGMKEHEWQGRTGKKTKSS